MRRTIESDLIATQWHFVVDNPDIHRSQSLVLDVAKVAGCSDGLGVKYVRVVRRSKASRAAFLIDPRHPIVFHYTPNALGESDEAEALLREALRFLEHTVGCTGGTGALHPYAGFDGPPARN